VLAGGVGVVEHHVVGIDQVDGQHPGIARPRHRLAAHPQPAPRLGADGVVVDETAVGQPDRIADAHIVVEPVFGEDRRQLLLRQRQLVMGAQCLGHVPLALVGHVVAGLGQHGAHGGQVAPQVVDPGEVHVVEQARLLDVAAGIDVRARRRADRGVDLVVGEGHPALPQPVAPRQGGRVEIAFLVGQDEQDVVGPLAGRRVGVAGRLRRRRCRTSLPQRAGPQRQRGRRGILHEPAPGDAGLALVTIAHGTPCRVG